MFYVFSQNNSGGIFQFYSEKGISHRVIIEADTEDLALEKAEEIGLYFNGCSLGRDCPCCGDRWSKYTDQVDNLSSYLEEAKKYCQLSPDVYVHFSNGKIEGYLFNETTSHN